MQALSPFTGNRILDALSPPVREALTDLLVPIRLTPPAVLFEPGADASGVFFPVEGMISIVVPFVDGSMIEAATVGREGMAGLPAELGGLDGRLFLIAQLLGRALVMPAPAFVAQVRRSDELRALVLRSNAALFSKVAQTAGCNRLHDSSGRLARWLLQVHDRAPHEAMAFDITHAFLGQMLGARRETVTVAAQTLQAAGLISYRRGRMTILDRDGLEAAACECYPVARADTEGVFAPEGTGRPRA